MNGLHLFRYIKTREYPFLIFCKLYLNGFNVFISFVLQIGITMAIQGNYRYLVGLLALLCLVSIGYAFLNYAYSMYSEYLHKRISEQVSVEILERTLSQRGTAQSNGHLVNLINQDADNIGNFFIQGVMPTIDFVLIIIYGLTYAFINSWQFGVFDILFGSLLYVISDYLYKMQQRYRVTYQKADDRQKNFLPELYDNLLVLKVLQSREWILKMNQRMFQEKKIPFLKGLRASSTNQGIVNGGIYVMEVMSLCVGLILVNNGKIGYGATVGLWNAGIGSIFDPFISLPIIMQFMVLQKSSAKRIKEHFISEKGEFFFPLSEQQDGSPSVEKVLVQQLNYVYPNSQKTLFHGLTFELQPNQLNYLVGDNGAGKTTLILLLMGVLTGFTGKISVLLSNNQRISSLLGFVAYVPQRGQFFSSTLRSNLIFDRNITDERIMAALDAVAMKNEILILPKQLDSVMFQDTNFSIGQIRRLAIARALLMERAFIILDEPFSDLDQQNQININDLLERLAIDHGIIVITHTYDLIRSSDKIIKVGN